MKYHYIFGPVPSRRLGRSLGVDLMGGGKKQCTLNCVYCQLGPTEKTTLTRRRFVDPDAVLEELKTSLAAEKPDYVTFSGTGEPTLSCDLGRIIEGVKNFTAVPVAVLTNGTLLFRQDVRAELAGADLVVPSLDAASREAFARVCRPHPELDVQKTIEGLIAFRQAFHGQLWLEILFVRGFNDAPADVEALVRAAEKIGPDRVQLNTVVRPPADSTAKPLSAEELAALTRRFGPTAEVIAEFHSGRAKQRVDMGADRLLSLLARRPETTAGLADALGVHEHEVLKFLGLLDRRNQIRREGDYWKITDNG